MALLNGTLLRGSISLRVTLILSPSIKGIAKNPVCEIFMLRVVFAHLAYVLLGVWGSWGYIFGSSRGLGIWGGQRVGDCLFVCLFVWVFLNSCCFVLLLSDFSRFQGLGN